MGMPVNNKPNISGHGCLQAEIICTSLRCYKWVFQNFEPAVAGGHQVFSETLRKQMIDVALTTSYMPAHMKKVDNLVNISKNRGWFYVLCARFWYYLLWFNKLFKTVWCCGREFSQKKLIYLCAQNRHPKIAKNRESAIDTSKPMGGRLWLNFSTFWKFVFSSVFVRNILYGWLGGWLFFQIPVRKSSSRPKPWQKTLPPDTFVRRAQPMASRAPPLALGKENHHVLTQGQITGGRSSRFACWNHTSYRKFRRNVFWLHEHRQQTQSIGKGRAQSTERRADQAMPTKHSKTWNPTSSPLEQAKVPQ